MFLGYCLHPVDGFWTPAVHLATVEEAFRYCILHHHWSLEIRITDEEDFVVLHVENHLLKIPMPDGSFKEHVLSL